MNRTEFTYGQLDRALHSLGFSCRLDPSEPPARIYEHPKSEALVVVPPLPESEKVYDYHLIGTRHILDEFGIADPKVFASELQRAA
jgi:hypothetical protein